MDELLAALRDERMMNDYVLHGPAHYDVRVDGVEWWQHDNFESCMFTAYSEPSAKQVEISDQFGLIVRIKPS